MRIVAILLISQVLCQTGVGQGTVYFCNQWGSHLIPAEAGTYKLTEGHAQLWAGTDETSMRAIVSPESPTTYFYDTGLFNGEEVTLANTPTASPILLLIRVWARNYATFENVTNSGAPFLESNIFPYTTGGPPTPAPFMEGLTSFTLKQPLIPLTITASNRSKTYGETVTFTGNEFIQNGLLGGDTITGVTISSPGAAANASVQSSPYAIVVNGAIGSGLSKYRISYVNGAMTVAPRPLTITANNRSKAYGATVVFTGSEFIKSGLINSDHADRVTLASAGAALGAAVGGSPYAIVPSAVVGGGLGNYTISYVNGAMTVAPRPLTITANNRSKAYGATVVFTGSEFIKSGLINSDHADRVTLASAGAALGAAVGGSPYAIVPSAVVGGGLGNYTISYVNGAMTVAPRPLTITANNRSKAYGATVVFTGSEFIKSGLINSDHADRVTLASAGAALGAAVGGSPYAIVPSAVVGGGLGNYTISYVNGAMTVAPRPLTITANNRSKAYGATVVFTGSEFIKSGLINSDHADRVTLASAGAALGAAVGGSPYAIVPSAVVGGGLGNYTISYVNGAMTVAPRPLTITANNRSKAYGATVVFTGSEFIKSGLINSDHADRVTLASAGAALGAAVGGSPYAIVPSAVVGGGLGNYTISYVNGAMTVAPRPLTITANNRSKAYGATVVFTGSEFIKSGLINSDHADRVTLASAGAALGAAVGGSPYAIVPSAVVGGGLGNYTISYVNGAMTVAPRPLTITANNRSKAYGATVVFTGSEFIKSGLINSDHADRVTLASAGAALGAAVGGSPYAIVPSAVVGGGLGNYTISYVNGAMTVAPRPLTITANNRSKAYGATVVFTGSEFIKSGLINSDHADRVTLASAGAALGAAVGGSPYAIVPSAVVGGGLGNYTISYVNGAMTVAPRPLTITANNRSKAYGETVTFTGTEFTKSGLINSDHADRVTLASAGAALGAAVGGSPYAIVPSAVVGGGLGNYTISYVNGTLTVVPNALRFLLPETQVENGLLKLVLATSDGVPVVLETTTNFKDWTTLDQSVSSNGKVTFTPAFAGSAAKRYYRARIP